MAESNRLESGHPSDGIVGSNPTLSDFTFELPSDSSFELRWTEASDVAYLRSWLLEPDVLRWFPMSTEVEVDDAIKYWMPNALNQHGITAMQDGIPIGIANLNRYPYRRMEHHALISIIVGGQWRGKGVGTSLLRNLIRLASEGHHFDYLMLEVYEGNPAKRLYERTGFYEIGSQPYFLREPDGTFRSKIIMLHPLGKDYGRSQ